MIPEPQITSQSPSFADLLSDHIHPPAHLSSPLNQPLPGPEPLEDPSIQELENLYRSHKTTLDNSKKDKLVSLFALKIGQTPQDHERKTKKEILEFLHNQVRNHLFLEILR